MSRQASEPVDGTHGNGVSRGIQQERRIHHDLLVCFHFFTTNEFVSFLFVLVSLQFCVSLPGSIVRWGCGMSWRRQKTLPTMHAFSASNSHRVCLMWLDRWVILLYWLRYRYFVLTCGLSWISISSFHFFLSLCCRVWLSDGKYLATGSRDKTVKVWDTEKMTQVHHYFGHGQNGTLRWWLSFK
jgi:hypothetical protein